MRLPLFVLLFSACLTASAQFRTHVGEEQSGAYVEEPEYKDAQNELDETHTQDDMPEIHEYLRQRDAARKQRQANRRNKSAIGLNRRRVDLNRRLNLRKCRDLKRWGLKCY